MEVEIDDNPGVGPGAGPVTSVSTAVVVARGDGGSQQCGFGFHCGCCSCGGGVLDGRISEQGGSGRVLHLCSRYVYVPDSSIGHGRDKNVAKSTKPPEPPFTLTTTTRSLQPCIPLSLVPCRLQALQDP